jgi:hypothetical protein
MTLTFTIESTDTAEGRSQLIVEAEHLYNFGYAGRDAAKVREHVEELAAIGLPAPRSIPAVFRLAPRLGLQDDALVVSGQDSYGEVEFALIKAPDQKWYVTVASDHSDLAIEKVSTARSKTVYPDLLATVAWPFDDVRNHWDQLILTNTRTDEAGSTVVQRAPVSDLLHPDDLITTLEARIGHTVGAGSIILSGTVAGLPEPGASGWAVAIADPVLDRTITRQYSVEGLVEELLDEGPDAT